LLKRSFLVKAFDLHWCEEILVGRFKADSVKTVSRILFVYLLIFYFTSSYVVSVYRIEGSSMQPLLNRGDRVVADRLVYKLSDIERNDVVVFFSPSDPHKYYIKRVVGLPGETIGFQDGDTYIDGKKLEEPFVPDNSRSHENLKTTLVPLGHYFVVGDNRISSNDSRSWTIYPHSWPFVGERYILGKIRCRVWPLNRIQWFSLETSEGM
jgi:signal peptidase I